MTLQEWLEDDIRVAFLWLLTSAAFGPIVMAVVLFVVPIFFPNAATERFLTLIVLGGSTIRIHNQKTKPHQR